MTVLEGYGNQSAAGLPQIALLEKPSNEFLIWFTAFLEADGHVRHSGNHMLKISQSGEKGKNQCIMMREMFGEVGSIHCKDYKDRADDRCNRDAGNWNSTYEWTVTDPEVIAQILEWIEPLTDPYTKLEDEIDYYISEYR